jgi:hypothetical protein
VPRPNPENPFEDLIESPLTDRLRHYERTASGLFDFCMERVDVCGSSREMRSWVDLARKCIVTASNIAQAALAPEQLDHFEQELKRVEARIADVRGGHRATETAAPAGSAPAWKRN